MNASHRFWMLRPKGFWGWACLILTGLTLGVSAPHTVNPQHVVGVAAGIGLPLLGWFSVPDRWLMRWAGWPRRVRCLLGFTVAYTGVVTALAAAELFTFPLWLDFLLPARLAPWTPVNTTGLWAGLTVFAGQFYPRPSPVPPDSETVVRGPEFISFADAEQRAEQLGSVPSGPPPITPIDNPHHN
jgi:hypothetical protein